MGLFGALRVLDSLLDEDGPVSLEKRLSGAIDKIEARLDSGLSKAEDTVRMANSTVDRLDKAGGQLKRGVDVSIKKIQG
jgi:hypothetical protein